MERCRLVTTCRLRQRSGTLALRAAARPGHTVMPCAHASPPLASVPAHHSPLPHPACLTSPLQGVCTTHSMDGCQDCSVAGTTFSKCPEVFNIYSKLCVCEYFAWCMWPVSLCLPAGGGMVLNIYSKLMRVCAVGVEGGWGVDAYACPTVLPTAMPKNC